MSRNIAYLTRAACLLLLVLSVGSCNKASGPAALNSYRPYSIDHAIMHFENFGEVRGTEDLFIDSFGHLEAHYIHSEHATQKAFEATITLSIKHWATATIIDTGHGQTVRLKDVTLDSLYHLPSGDVPSAEEHFGSVFTQLGYHQAGDTTLAGIHMHIWQLASDPVFVFEWHGILVGRKIGPPGMGMELRLVSVDTTSAVDPARFQSPTTYPIRDLASPPPGTVPPTMRHTKEDE